ncbi:MAG TPA: hypothetical protein VFD92_25255 [Candidatus Binatia bacterium]|nr:hypothetical protein [Candidatus Binatia bacterium]
MLMLYGFFVNGDRSVDFGRLLGVYVAVFFVVTQLVSVAVFRGALSPATIAGGLLIVLGGFVIPARTMTARGPRACNLQEACIWQCWPFGPASRAPARTTTDARPSTGFPRLPHTRTWRATCILALAEIAAMARERIDPLIDGSSEQRRRPIADLREIPKRPRSNAGPDQARPRVGRVRTIVPLRSVDVLRVPPSEDPRRDRRERVLIWLVTLVSLIALVGWIAWSVSEERRAIAHMPPEQRRVIYDHTMDTIRSMCADRSDAAIRQRCREQAQFLLAFPECDADCEQALEPLFQHPTR